MDLISSGKHVTAGQLAEHLHVTTGAITGLIDRLERSGFARRQADPGDRRRVVVVPTRKGDRVGELFGPLAIALRRTTEGYSEKDLLLLTEFIRKMRAAVAGTVEGIRGP
jgi:Transcriptional regulators